MDFKKIGIKRLSAQALSKLRRGLPARVMAGEGMQIMMMPHQFNLVSKAFLKNKGMNLTLQPAEVEANAVEGEGIFGKKADKFMEKKGIKKFVYKVGSAVKPLAMEAIDAAATMATAYGVPPSVVALAQKETKGYIDKPEDYQTKKGQRALLNRVGKTASEVAMPMLEDAGIDMQQVKDARKLAKDMKVMSKSGGPPMSAASMKGDAEEAFLSTLQSYMDKRASSAPAKMMSTNPFDLVDRDGIIGNGLYAGASGRGIGMGMYAGAGLASTLKDMGKKFVNQSRTMVGSGHPALDSNPEDANFLSRNQMPPSYQRMK